MTTVAFCDGTMAADTQITDGSDSKMPTIYSKLHRLKSGAILGQTGENADIRELKELLDSVKYPSDLPKRRELMEIEMDFEGLLYLPGKTLWSIEIDYDKDKDKWDASIVQIKKNYYAIGSGGAYAIGAMEAGAKAKLAVEIACMYDIYSSEPIETMMLLDAKEKK